MAWTADDIAKLRAAIVALASGSAVQSVTYNGPPSRSVTYKQANLSEMRELLVEMERSVSGGPRYIRLGTSKGLDS
ncbi:gpW family head-tail joining protein [Myxococcus stipitatus]|uniref:gpW family head-tail joining protein n=1 Tax=Myxococcus stipitatus TaxID=83455 RepID=UPI0009FD4286